jgi:hypothetical protein
LSSLVARARHALHQHRGAILLLSAALLVRLGWNLFVHPPGEYLYSDMAGYEERALSALRDPWTPDRWAVFFPYGTHVLLAGAKLFFGPHNQVASAVLLALLGALLPLYTFLIARRVCTQPWVAPAVAWLMVFYYPLISLGGYLLSEVPFCFALLGSTYYGLRLVDHGRPRDAYASGAFAAVAIAIRPQMLASCALFGAYWLLARRHMPRVGAALLLRAALPVAALLACSAIRFHHHTGRVGLIAENGSLNLMFGRCHCATIEALGELPASFGLPEFGALASAEAQGRRPIVRLSPALEETIRYRGYIGDADIHFDYLRRCIGATGWVGQLSYSLSHLVLLWGQNLPWPDQGQERWRPWALVGQLFATGFLCLPGFLGLLALFSPRRFLAIGLLNLHTAALFLTSMVSFGGTRHRNPYDPLFLIVAAAIYSALYRGWRARRCAAAPK